MVDHVFVCVCGFLCVHEGRNTVTPMQHGLGVHCVCMCPRIWGFLLMKFRVFLLDRVLNLEMIKPDGLLINHKALVLSYQYH